MLSRRRKRLRKIIIRDVVEVPDQSVRNIEIRASTTMSGSGGVSRALRYFSTWTTIAVARDQGSCPGSDGLGALPKEAALEASFELGSQQHGLSKTAAQGCRQQS